MKRSHPRPRQPPTTERPHYARACTCKRARTPENMSSNGRPRRAALCRRQATPRRSASTILFMRGPLRRHNTITAHAPAAADSSREYGSRGQHHGGRLTATSKHTPTHTHSEAGQCGATEARKQSGHVQPFFFSLLARRTKAAVRDARTRTHMHTHHTYHTHTTLTHTHAHRTLQNVTNLEGLERGEEQPIAAVTP